MTMIRCLPAVGFVQAARKRAIAVRARPRDGDDFKIDPIFGAPETMGLPGLPGMGGAPDPNQLPWWSRSRKYRDKRVSLEGEAGPVMLILIGISVYSHSFHVLVRREWDESPAFHPSVCITTVKTNRARSPLISSPLLTFCRILIIFSRMFALIAL